MYCFVHPVIHSNVQKLHILCTHLKTVSQTYVYFALFWNFVKSTSEIFLVWKTDTFILSTLFRFLNTQLKSWERNLVVLYIFFLHLGVAACCTIHTSFFGMVFICGNQTVLLLFLLTVQTYYWYVDYIPYWMFCCLRICF